jgi:hypothetical protein
MVCALIGGIRNRQPPPRCYAAAMHETPWGLICVMFAYAFAGWAVLLAIHFHMKRRRTPRSAREAAQGYGDSWQSTNL